MADMSALATTENYAALLARMDAKLNGIAQMFMGDDPTNIPAGKTPIRFNAATSAWEVWDGSAWGALSDKYVITVDKADSLKDSGGAYRAANTGAVANTIAVRDATGKLPGSITGDAATVGGKAYTYFATAAQGTKADAALPAASYTAADVLAKIKTVDGAGSGLDADTVDGIAGASIITTGNIGSQSVAYADDAGNATSANNATTAGGKAINAAPVANTIPVRGANVYLNEIYSGTFSSLTAAGITIPSLSLQQYGVVDIYITAKLTAATSDWLTVEVNGDSTANNYWWTTAPVDVADSSTPGLPPIGTVAGTAVTGFVHIRLYLGTGLYCYGRAVSNCGNGAATGTVPDYATSGGPFTETGFYWKSTANVTQLRFFMRNSRVIANGAKVVICRAA